MVLKQIFDPVISAFCYRLSFHNLNVIILSYPSSLGCFLLPIIHPQSLSHYIISSLFSRLLPVTDYPSTISMSSYHVIIPVLSAASCYLLSIHNLHAIISSHPSSLGCFLFKLPIIDPQSLHNHIMSSQFFRLLPCCRLSIHNFYVTIPSHPCSLSCFLLPIIHSPSLPHHITSS